MLVGYTSSTGNQALGYGLLGGLVVFTMLLIWLRRTQWRSQSWQGIVKAKYRRSPGLIPLFRQPYELVITQTYMSDFPVRVSRQVYNEVQIGESVRKNSADNNVYIG